MQIAVPSLKGPMEAFAQDLERAKEQGKILRVTHGKYIHEGIPEIDFQRETLVFLPETSWETFETGALTKEMSVSVHEFHSSITVPFFQVDLWEMVNPHERKGK